MAFIPLFFLHIDSQSNGRTTFTSHLILFFTLLAKDFRRRTGGAYL